LGEWTWSQEVKDEGVDAGQDKGPKNFLGLIRGNGDSPGIKVIQSTTGVEGAKGEGQ